MNIRTQLESTSRLFIETTLNRSQLEIGRKVIDYSAYTRIHFVKMLLELHDTVVGFYRSVQSLVISQTMLVKKAYWTKTIAVQILKMSVFFLLFVITRALKSQ